MEVFWRNPATGRVERRRRPYLPQSILAPYMRDRMSARRYAQGMVTHRIDDAMWRHIMSFLPRYRPAREADFRTWFGDYWPAPPGILARRRRRRRHMGRVVRRTIYPRRQ